MKHYVADTGERFVISPNTKGIVRPSGQMLNLVQFDHNSERITFEVPRYIDLHDMSLCNRVEVHYLNTDIDTQITNEGLYVVDDLQIDTDDDTKVVCTWLISQNATQLKGALSFLLSFKCVQDDGTIDYVWNTAVYTDASVVGGINVSDVVVEQYTDVLQQWYIKLFEMEGGNIDQHTGEPVLFATVTQDVYDAMSPEEIIPNCHYLIEDDDTFEQFEAAINTALQQMDTATETVNKIAENISKEMDTATENINKTAEDISGQMESVSTDINELDQKVTDELKVHELVVNELLGYFVGNGSTEDYYPKHDVVPDTSNTKSCTGSITFRKQGHICTANFQIEIGDIVGMLYLLYDNIPEAFRPTTTNHQAGLLHDPHKLRTKEYTEMPVYINNKELKIHIGSGIEKDPSMEYRRQLIGSLIYFV